MKHGHIKDVVEILYLSLMLRWQRTAPPDRHAGLLDDKPERNTQTSRLAYAIMKIAAGNEVRTYNLLATHCRRKDGKSYFSKDFSWMIEPYPLTQEWYFEGCTSLIQKQSFIQHLTKLGLSPVFIACMDDFVANKDVQNYLPTIEEQDEILREIENKEKCHV
jgi:hypothetical protein